MISVTLQFADAAALVAYFSGAAPLTKANAATISEAATPAKPKAEKPAAPAPVAAASAPAPVASAPAASAAEAATDYPTLQKAVFKLAGIATGGRDAATALLAKFEVKTFKDLAQDKWADALAAVNAQIEQLSVPA